jgi:hypothetical protein
MKGDVEELYNIFEEIDKEIERKYGDIKIKVNLLGGSFFVLNQLRKNSLDIDFLVESSEAYRVLNEVADHILKEHNMTMDILYGGTLVEKILPSNYTKHSKLLKRDKNKRKHLEIWTLSPYYILLSKIDRYNEKDKNDIDLIFNSEKFKIRKATFFKLLRTMNVSLIKVRYKKNLIDFLSKYEDKMEIGFLEKNNISKMDYNIDNFL